jgi:hypothetical protein
MAPVVENNPKYFLLTKFIYKLLNPFSDSFLFLNGIPGEVSNSVGKAIGFKSFF